MATSIYADNIELKIRDDRDRNIIATAATNTSSPITYYHTGDIIGTVKKDVIDDRFNITSDKLDIMKYINDAGLTKKAPHFNLPADLQDGTKLFYSKWHVVMKPPFGEADIFETVIDPLENKFAAFCEATVRSFIAMSVKCGDDRRDQITPISILRDGMTTTVTFADGSRVSATCSMNDYNNRTFESTGYYICVAKKIFGTTGNIMANMKRTDYAKLKKDRKELRQKLNKEAAEARRRMNENNRQILFKKDVEQRMHDILVEREARRRIELMDAAKAKKAEKSQE